MLKEFPRAQRQRDAHSHSSIYLHPGSKLKGGHSISVGSKPVNPMLLSQVPPFSSLFSSWELSCLMSQVPIYPIQQFISLETCLVKSMHNSSNSQRGNNSFALNYPIHDAFADLFILNVLLLLSVCKPIPQIWNCADHSSMNNISNHLL